MNIASTDGITPDHAYIKEGVKLLERDDLIIFDLGYSNKEAMFEVDYREAFFLSRLNHQLNLCRKDRSGELVKFDLVKELRKREDIACSLEYDVWIRDKKNKDSYLKLRLNHRVFQKR